MAPGPVISLSFELEAHVVVGCAPAKPLAERFEVRPSKTYQLSPLQSVAIDSDSMLRRRLRRYATPDFLAIDEVGYLSYSNRHADLLFELVSRRYEAKSTLVTTNKPFATWPEMFPNAACVVSMVDRLLHHAEVIAIEGESYRLKEAKERTEQRTRQRRSAKNTPG